LCNSVFDDREKESLGINIIDTVDKLKSIVSVAGPILGYLSSYPHLAAILSPIGLGLDLSQKVTEYIANKCIMLLQDLTKHLGQIESINNQIKNLFGFPLSNGEIIRLHILMAHILKYFL
jgi:hypothetical protein